MKALQLLTLASTQLISHFPSSTEHGEKYKILWVLIKPGKSFMIFSTEKTDLPIKLELDDES